ncbi:enoyl-CoA hydratase-related protein [Pseudomonas sp. Marseille-P9899]|uniref:enoyl-CoA hydratase-related protein n=1 Tax=Pseudomonas sp. Marseille-P9899 TaxID=2730401 RepID=UPI0015894360|nr:enoyl-CoA hydratase-related protein [Pseudomonas sp. Marseille-P9899]
MHQPFSYITYETRGAVALLSLNLPHKLNGMSAPMQAEIRAVLEHLQTQGDVRALVITGSGRAFCSGADLGDISQKGDGRAQAESTYRAMVEQSNPMILDIRQSRIPVVAAVNGIAAGAGASLALAADVVVAGRSASFLMPFAPRLGIVPDLGATWLLPRLLGEARARAALLLGERISAEQLEQWGGIWACVEDAELLDTALELAGRLAASPRHSAEELKRALDCAEHNSLAEQLQYEADRQRELIAHADFQEGVAAFLGKRAPVFP